jgi:hypothetical protein
MPPLPLLGSLFSLVVKAACLFFRHGPRTKAKRVVCHAWAPTRRRTWPSGGASMWLNSGDVSSDAIVDCSGSCADADTVVVIKNIPPSLLLLYTTREGVGTLLEMDHEYTPASFVSSPEIMRGKSRRARRYEYLADTWCPCSQTL